MSQLGCNDEGSEGIVKLCLVGSDDKISRPGSNDEGNEAVIETPSKSPKRFQLK